MTAFVHVRKPLRSAPWLVYCDPCDFNPIPGVTPIRKCKDQSLATAWAIQHARKHADQMCQVCEHMRPIVDTTTRLEQP